MKHSNLGASGAERWFNCSGSVELQKGIPNTSSEAAKEGTLAHELAEQILLGETNIALEKLKNQESQEMLDAVWVYTDYVLNKVKKPNQELHVERQFDLSFIHEGMFGTNDACIIDRGTKTLEIIDYKHGEGKYVEVENNLQLLYYALGAYYNLAIDRLLPLSNIKLTIVQPRFKGADPIRSWEIDVKTLLEFEGTLRQKVKKVLENPELKMGEWCRWCTAKAVCPLQKSKALEVARANFGVDKKLQLPEIKALTNKELSEVLNYKKDINSWLIAVEKEALRLAIDGEDIHGYAVSTKKTHRKWSVEDKKLIEFLTQAGLAEKEILQVITPSQVEKKLSKINKEYKSLVDELTIRPKGADTLVRIPDDQLDNKTIRRQKL